MKFLGPNKELGLRLFMVLLRYFLHIICLKKWEVLCLFTL